jgi:hypothetical protein
MPLLTWDQQSGLLFLEPAMEPCLTARCVSTVSCCRIFLILLYAAGLDSLWTRAALQAATASSSWQARLGLLGVLLPLAFNSVGLLWPLLSLKTFERHYASFHKVCLQQPSGSAA